MFKLFLKPFALISSILVITAFFFIISFYWDFVKIYFVKEYKDLNFAQDFSDRITPASFKAIDMREFLYAYDTDSIWLVYPDNGIISIENIDVSTFEFVNINACFECYAKDKDNVYYIMGFPNDTYDEVHPYSIEPGLRDEKVNSFIVKDAKNENFKDLDGGLGNDDNNYYLYGRNIEENI